MPDSVFYDVVLVGGGPASRILNKHLRKLRPDLTTVVVRDEERIVNHCGTPYIVEGEIPWERGLIPEKLVEQFGTEILVDPLVGGDPERHEIELRSGRRLRYGSLVCATGSDQVLPPIPGTDLDGVLKVRRTEDVRAAMAALEGLDRVAVVGGGYIGLEFAVSLRNMGKSVTLVELLPRVMGDRIDANMADTLADRLRDLRVNVRLGARAERIEGDDGAVTALLLAGGERIEVDAVLSAVGVAPNVGYAASLGLETSREGIVVDERFRTNLPDVYAVGDCAATRCLVTDRVVPGKLGSNAGQMARTLAMRLADVDDRPYPGVVNAAVTRLAGLAYGAAGLSEADAAAAGIEVLTGRVRAADRYDNMPDPRPVEAKVIYRAEDLVLLGGEILGEFNPSGFVEALAQMIERRLTLHDVVAASYSSHPELTPKTSHPYWVSASEALLFRIAARDRDAVGGTR